MSLIRLSLNCCCFTTWFILLSVTKKSLPLAGSPFYANGPSERKEIKSNQISSLICMIGQASNANGGRMENVQREFTIQRQLPSVTNLISLGR